MYVVQMKIAFVRQRTPKFYTCCPTQVAASCQWRSYLDTRTRNPNLIFTVHSTHTKSQLNPSPLHDMLT